MTYDGTTSLQPVIAKIIGCSPKSQAQIAKAVKTAKTALGIETKTRVLPTETRVQVYNYLVELYSQDNNKPVEIISQDNNPEPLKPESTNNAPVELYSHTDNFDSVRIAFYTGTKRQVIALDGFFINALESIGISKQDIPQWLTKQVKDWAAFDAKLPVTRQVKYLIMREVVKGLGGNDNVFYAKL